MKSIMKFNTSLAITALILTAALVVPAAAQKQVPFKGSIQAQETDTPSVPPGTLSAAGSGTGIGTQVGQFSLSYDLTVTLATALPQGLVIGSQPMEIPSIRQLPDRVYRRLHPMSLASGKFTSLLVGRVDS